MDLTCGNRSRLRRIGLLATIGCLWFFSSAAALQPPTENGDQELDPEVRVAIQVEREEIGVADPFEVKLEAILEGPHSSAARVVLEDGENLAGVWEVLSIEDQKAVPVGAGQTRWTRRYQIETLFPGLHQIPKLSVTVNDRRYVTEPMPIRVLSSVDPERDPTQIQPLKGPVLIPEKRNRFRSGLWITGLATLLGLAAVWTAAILIRRRARRPDPQFWALSQIGKLETEMQLEKAGPEQLLPRIADLLRLYIHRRWGLPASAQTTPEFLDLMADDFRLSLKQQQELRQFLQEVDRIKFAGYSPQDPSVQGALDRARKFILESPIPVTAPR